MVSTDSYCSSVGALERDTILDFTKKVLLPLEPKLLVMLGRIGEVLQIVYEVLHIV